MRDHCLTLRLIESSILTTFGPLVFGIIQLLSKLTPKFRLTSNVYVRRLRMTSDVDVNVAESQRSSLTKMQDLFRASLTRYLKRL